MGQAGEEGHRKHDEELLQPAQGVEDEAEERLVGGEVDAGEVWEGEEELDGGGVDAEVV